MARISALSSLVFRGNKCGPIVMDRSRGLYLHTSLARTVYERIQTDNEMKQFDKDTWYSSDMKQFSSSMQSTFVQLNCDSETESFLDNCSIKADSILTQIFHTLATTFLTAFMAKTSINGLLGRGSMFVFSSLQLEYLMDIPSSWKGENLLDLGAGDGKVTDIMSSYFRHISVTEASMVMRKVLTNKKYRILEIDNWYQEDTMYDVISCLNLLDRCERPILMLHQMAGKVVPDTGRLIIAIVIPFAPYVEFGTNGTSLPVERLHVLGRTFEEQVSSLVDNVFSPLGLEVVRWSKLPYLCEGNLQQTFYHLTDAVFVLKLKADMTTRDENVTSAATCLIPTNGEQQENSADKCSSVIVNIPEGQVST